MKRIVSMSGKNKDTFVSILGVNYNILKRADGEMQGSAGAAILDQGTILINSGIAIQRQKQRLLHETLHIISDELELNLNEKQIMGLAAGLYSMGFRVKESK